MEQYFFPLVYSSQEGLIYILLNISQTNSLEPQIPNKLDPGEWTTILTHKNDPQVWFTRMIHDIDPRVWPTRPTRMTHEFNPRVWPTRMTHELDPRQWSMSLTHEIDPQDPRDPRDLAHLFGATVPSSLINIKLRTCPSASNRTLPVSKEYLVILSFIFFAYALKVNRQPNINFKNW